MSRSLTPVYVIAIASMVVLLMVFGIHVMSTPSTPYNVAYKELSIHMDNVTDIGTTTINGHSKMIYGQDYGIEVKADTNVMVTFAYPVTLLSGPAYLSNNTISLFITQNVNLTLERI